MLLLLISSVFAEVFQPAFKETHVVIQRTDEPLKIHLKISVLVFPPEVSVPGFQQESNVQSIIKACQQTKPDEVEKCLLEKSSEDLDNTQRAKKIPETAANKVLKVEYLTAGGFASLAGCDNIKTDQMMPVQSPSGDLVNYYYAVCDIDLNQFKGTNRLIIKITFIPDDPALQFAQNTITIDNAAGGTVVDQFNTNLNDFIASVASAGGTGVGPGTLPCFGVFLILGLLLASMYFAGKSPISLLDITTPRLPTPKGVVAGGQVLGPFGYTEMKNATKMKMKANMKAIEETVKKLSLVGRLDGTTRNLMNSVTKGRFVDRSKALGAGDAAEQQAVVKGLIAGGHLVGITPDRLANLTNKLPYYYGQEEHRIAADIIRRLELSGGQNALLAMTIKDSLLGIRTFQSLEVLTGHPEMRREGGWYYMATAPLGKMFGANRYAILSGIVMSGTDSMFRSGRLIGRMTWAGIKHAPVMVGAIAKQPLNWTGATAALQRKAATSPVAKAIYDSVTYAPKIEIGNMFPIIDKMQFHYRTLRDEVLRDEMRYVLRQIYRKMGIEFNISEQRMLEMGHKDVDILRESNYHNARANLADVERQIRAILSAPLLIPNPPAGLSFAQEEHHRDVIKFHADFNKLEQLINLANTHGAHIDVRALNLRDRVEHIENDNNTPEYFKALALTSELDAHNVVRTNALSQHTVRADDYHCHVGGDSLRGTEIWETHVLRKMVWDAENGYLTHGGIAEELKAARLNIVNRLATLDPTAADSLGKPGYLQLPTFMHDLDDLHAVARRNRSDLLSLFTDEGRAHFADIRSAQGKDPNLNNASIAEIVSFMEGGRIPKHGELQGGRMIHWVAQAEFGLPQNNTLVDLKGQWATGLEARKNFALSQWTESRFTRGYAVAYKGSIEAELNDLERRQGAAFSDSERTERAKMLWIRDLFVQDMEQRFNSVFGHNTYGTTHETTRFHTGVICGFLQKALKDEGRPETDPLVQELNDLNTDDRTKRGRLLEILTQHQAAFEKQIYDRAADGTLTPKKVHESDISGAKTAMVMLQEGGYAYYKKGMILSDQDRILGGEMSIRDHKGQLRKFDPDDVTVKFGDDPQGQHLAGMWGNLQSLRSKYTIEAERQHAGGIDEQARWGPFVAELQNWAKSPASGSQERYERQKVLGSVLWRYGQTTHDYTRFWHDCDVSIAAKREVTPLTPGLFRHFGAGDTAFGDALASAYKPIRDLALPAGDYLTRIALLAGGSLFKASYDVIPTSEYYRQHSMKLASRIFAKEFESGLDDEEKRLYNAVAMSHGAYHQVWDYCIDRHPGRTSTSYGSHNAWAGFFQFGPSTQYGVADNLRAYLDNGQYWNFMFHGGFAMDLAGAAFAPFLNQLRGLQMSMQGYASKWDATDDALKQWDYTTPRVRESMQILNPFAFGRGLEGFGYKFPKFIGNVINKLSSVNYIESSLERRQLAGVDFQKGLWQAPQDIFLTRKGVYMSARTDEENPGLSHTNYRKEIRMDAGMMEYLFRGQEASYLYDVNARRMAMENTVRRNVGAEALAIRRNQELYSFGILQNSMWGWANPLAFVWHVPPPGFPPSITPKDIITKFVGWAKHGQPFFGGGGFFKSAAFNVTTFMQPHKLSMVVYCPMCSTPNYRGSRCRTCRSLQY
ncbi:hypothetical protein HY988_03950 [Candidatus Micrarchaeota archaeon]|nr:hypothetical protein [Candidatus Micrarchaeota archaeon]